MIVKTFAERRIITQDEADMVKLLGPFEVRGNANRCWQMQMCHNNIIYKRSRIRYVKDVYYGKQQKVNISNPRKLMFRIRLR